MTTRTRLIDYALVHGWDDDDVEALEKALTDRSEEAFEEALALFGERNCPPAEYCELAALLLEWHQSSDRFGLRFQPVDATHWRECGEKPKS